MTIGWGMIGTGNMHKRMAPVIKEARDISLVAVLSRDKNKAAIFAE